VTREIPELDRKGLRNFAWMFAAVVAGLFGLILPWLFNLDWPSSPWLIAIVFFVWGLVAPNTLRSLYRLWVRFAFVMNFLVTRIVLGVVFFIGLLPFRIAFRLRGKDPMRRKWTHDSDSYRVPSHKPRSRHMKDPY
jgi:hypothetical protein